MSEAAAGVGHNTIVGAELKRFVERIENLEAEIKALNADKSEVYQELKDRGFDAPTVRQIVKLRRMDKAEREEKEALLDLYKNALGMLADTPLGRAAAGREFGGQVDLEEAIAGMGKPVPLTDDEKADGGLAAFEDTDGTRMTLSTGSAPAKQRRRRLTADEKTARNLAAADGRPWTDPRDAEADEPPPATADPVGAVVEMPTAPEMPAAAE